MKKEGRNSQDQINEEEISNLPEREFRIMMAKMLQILENRMEKMQEAFNTVNTITKDTEEIKNKQTEMNNIIIEIKNTLLLLLLSHFSRVRLCATPEMAAHQASPSLGVSRQEHWSGLPFPSPMHESEKGK